MTKHISISANENPLYLFYLPLTCWAWNKFGWKPVIILVKEKPISKNELVFNLINRSINCDRISVHLDAEEFVNRGYETSTIAQLSRLYAAVNIKDGDYLMTGDSDMIPLSNYWDVDFLQPSIWGWNLTEYQHVPICYVGMRKNFWFHTMGIDYEYEDTDWLPFMVDDLWRHPNAKSNDKTKRWVIDQDVLTERITKQWKKEQLHLNHRGVYPNGYPLGRVDRSAWSQNHEKYIDCHAPHDILTNPESRLKLLHLLKFIWPNEDFTWWKEYQKEFLELLKK